MKEYWVNVYEQFISTMYDNPKDAYEWNIPSYKAKRVKYRLHVREFESREEKELYLKKKYDKIDFSKCSNLHIETRY